MLTASQIAKMQATSDLAQPDTGTIYRATNTADGAGGYTQAWAAVATVDIRLDQPRGYQNNLTIYADKIGTRATFIANLAVGVDIQEGDYVDYGGTRYDVIAVLDPIGYEIVKLVILARQE